MPPSYHASTPTDEELLGWDGKTVEAFAEREAPEELARAIQRLIKIGSPQAITVLRMFLGARGAGLYDKPMPSQLALRGLVLCGPDGIDAVGVALRTQRVRYAAKVVVVLLRVAEGSGLVNPMQGRMIPDDFLDRPLPPGSEEAAQKVVAGIASEAVTEVPGATRVIAHLLFESAMDADEADAAAVIQLLTEASIRLTPGVLDQFEALIEVQKTEQDYQSFLEQHPVLLDPLAAEVVSKQRLGVEYATDFALRRHDGGWTLVEIEKPQDRMFTTSDDFTAPFTHAFGQVLDFQHWVDNNVAYAQTLMPGIAAPRGLLIMGTRQPLTERQSDKLKQFCDNSRRIEIVTYDELLARGRQLYDSLWHRSRVEQG